MIINHKVIWMHNLWKQRRKINSHFYYIYIIHCSNPSRSFFVCTHRFGIYSLLGAWARFMVDIQVYKKICWSLLDVMQSVSWILCYVLGEFIWSIWWIAEVVVQLIKHFFFVVEKLSSMYILIGKTYIKFN